MRNYERTQFEVARKDAEFTTPTCLFSPYCILLIYHCIMVLNNVKSPQKKKRTRHDREEY